MNADYRPCKGDAFHSVGAASITCRGCQHVAREVWDVLHNPPPWPMPVTSATGLTYGKCLGPLGFQVAREAGVKLEGDG
jgi:hypothetical protein